MLASILLAVSVLGILTVVSYRIYRNIRSIRGTAPRMSDRQRMNLAGLNFGLIALFVVSLILSYRS